MAFWSGERLASELPDLVHPFSEKNIDCASYRLSVGGEAFVTSDKLDPIAAAARLVTVLSDRAPDNMLRIAPGQFAFILTEESVEVPCNAIALISMRAKYKFKGLINVSGFHVDPGWKGNLLFSIYNAGPQAVFMKRGDPLFLIVYADLDRDSSNIYNGNAKGQASIDSGLLSDLTGQVFSPKVLQTKLDETNAYVQDLKNLAFIFGGIASGLAIIVGIAISMIAFYPSWTGVVIARSLDAAHFEVHQKVERPEPSSNKDELPPRPPKARGQNATGATKQGSGSRNRDGGS
jgi:dCTP deaminase